MRDKFDETGPSVMVQKVIDWSVSPPRKMKCRAFTNSHQKSKQRASIELGISQRSLSHLMQYLGLKMYWPRLLHGLLEDGLDRHLQFCEVILNNERQGNGIADKITWPDEAHFKLSGAVNQHNYVCVLFNKKSPCNDRTIESAGDYSLGGSFM